MTTGQTASTGRPTALLASLLLAMTLAACNDDLTAPPGAPTLRHSFSSTGIAAQGGPQVDAGESATCAVKTDTSVVCWGEVDPPPGLTNVSQVSVGINDACALRTDGTVLCWGGANVPVPPVGLTSVAQISFESTHVCALKTDGTVVCFGGSNGFGENTPPADLDSVVQVTTGDVHSCALRADGSVVCWGIPAADPPAGLGPASQISSGGGYHVCVLQASGTVGCWGENAEGEATPPPGLSGVTQISAGVDHTCAVNGDGTVTCWGSNADGMSTPPAGLGSVTQVTSGWSHACALRASGNVVCWGADDDGESTPPAGLNLLVFSSQQIAFTSTPPSPAVLGDAYAVTANGGGSGNPVVFTSLTPTTCSVSGSTVGLIAIGTCTIAANQAGSGLFNPAPQETQSFNVVFDFVGFGPLSSTSLTSIRAGAKVNIEFSLDGNQGFGILAAGSPRSGPTNCSVLNAPTSTEPTAVPFQGKLTYTARKDRYTYPWQTEKGWLGTCRQFVIQLSDGTSHIANIRFVK